MRDLNKCLDCEKELFNLTKFKDKNSIYNYCDDCNNKNGRNLTFLEVKQ